MKEILSVFIFACLLFSSFASDIEETLSRRALKAAAFFIVETTDMTLAIMMAR